MVWYKLSLKRLLVTFCLLLVLACLHFLVTISSDGRHIDININSNFNLQRSGKLFWYNSAGNNATDPQIIDGSETVTSDKKKPWYFLNGMEYPLTAEVDRKTGRRLSSLWPEEAPGNDRILNQLMYIPPNYNNTVPLKKILLYNGADRFTKIGQKTFTDLQCPVDRCTISSDIRSAHLADAILFKDRFVLPKHVRNSNQVWILYLLECPYHTEVVHNNDLINWTATYRRDSDIVTPYEKWVYYDENVKGLPNKRNYAANKTSKVAWFVSNCGARNGRLRYAHELQKHIPVDIYGFCGPLKCPRTKQCFNLLDQKYKFYLAFENSNCIDYITEKFFVNGLQHDVVPIVMGARPKDYEIVAPYHSYIHVDDFESPKELAEYLHKLDQNDELYNSYFRWKGTGEFINTRFFCRLCAMLHDNYSRKMYANINRWWRNSETCVTSGSWSNIST